MQVEESISKYRLKRLLDALSSKEGRGTELISLYIPPEKKIHEVMANLREEYGTASNIKSRTTRKNVQEAIEKVTQRLKLFKSPPPNGLVVFCGAIPQNGPGSERMEIYALEPPEPINIYYYRCDSRFHLEPLRELLREKESYGILLIDASQATLALLEGRRMEILGEYHSGVGGKHKTGGQSARRFERIREQEINDYFKRVAAHVDEALLKKDNLKGIIIGGPGPTKEDFIEGEYLNYLLRSKVLATVDTSYVGRSGAAEVVSKASEILRGVRYSEEKKVVQRFLFEIGHETGLGVYGESLVRRHLENRMVDTLLLSEKLTLLHVFIKCSTCGFLREELTSPDRLLKIQNEITSSKCPSCSAQSLMVAEVKDLVDEFIEIGEEAGAKIELISTETDEGVMLLKSFGGIGAILKYKPSSGLHDST
ncbi:MAG: peptide chain release factor aRF-1 [Candidatus Bathyarchaeia archaeon]